MNKIALKSLWTLTVTLSIEKVHVCLYSCKPSIWTGSLQYKFYSGSFPGSSCLFLKQTCGIFWTLEISPLTSRNQRATDRPLQSIFICATKLYSLNPRPVYLLYRYGNFFFIYLVKIFLNLVNMLLLLHCVRLWDVMSWLNHLLLFTDNGLSSCPRNIIIMNDCGL